MGQKIISNPQININDELILFVPSTLKYIKNTAKTEISSLTAGGNSVISVHSTDISDSLSKVSFSVKATDRTIELLDEWSSGLASNVIEVSSQNGVIALAFTGMSLEEVPDMDLGAKSEIEVVFKGDPIS